LLGRVRLPRRRNPSVTARHCAAARAFRTRRILAVANWTTPGRWRCLGWARSHTEKR